MLSPTIKKLNHWIHFVPQRIEQIPTIELERKPLPDKWSKKEILGHLIDSGINNWLRFTNAQQAGKHFVVKPYQQAESVRLNHYQHQPIGQILELWKAINMQISKVWEQIPEESLSKTVVLPNSSPKTLLWLIEDYVEHMEHHLAQLFPIEEELNIVLPENWQMSIEAALAKLSDESAGTRFTKLLERGKMYVEIYVPEKVDLQTPHDQDEIYVIISGSGTFFNNGERQSFQQGDVLFVPAGIEHRFEDFTEDFKTWVIFY